MVSLHGYRISKKSTYRISPYRCSSYSLLLVFEFPYYKEHVPVCCKENQGTNTCNAPGFDDNKRGENERNDKQRDKHNVNQRLVDLFGVHSGFLSLLMMILMLIELSHVVKEKQQLYSTRRTIRLVSPYH